MAKFEMKIWLVVIAALSMVSNNICVNGKPQVPCFFIFGDSLADNGNNNMLLTLAKVNYPPYGIDFPDGPTGRFSNGRTTVDIIAELLGFDKRIPSFVAASYGFDYMRGVNYASGAAGILTETGKHLGDNISFRRQVKNHWTTTWRIGNILDSRNLAEMYLNKCLYWVEMGNNDYINNYFLPWSYSTSLHYNPEQYAALLIKNYRVEIMELYNSGGRMFALLGLGQIGCTPNSISVYGTSSGAACVDYMNTAVEFFNKKLIALVDELNSNLRDAKFVYVNSYGIGSGDPTAAGFKVWGIGCCAVNNMGQCIHFKTPCQNKTEYVFWDSFHPTEASNLITASRIYKASDSSDSYPMDISLLVESFGVNDAVAATAETKSIASY